MSNLIQQLIHLSKRSIFNIDTTVNQPLLNNSEILVLLHKVQSNKKSRPHKRDISFRQIGDVRSIYRGQGMDYEESRLYQAGDDPRNMNWQLSARTGQHYMKVFREERQPGVFILVDRRNNMRFGTKQRLKITQAVRTAAMAAFSAQEKNFSIGGVILDNELEWFKENQNKQAVFDFIHQAARPAIPVFENNTFLQPNINDVLRLLNEVITAGSTVYLISDFHDLDASSQATLLQLSSLHQIHAVQITDPAEISLPKSGKLCLKSANSHKQQHIDSSSKIEQESYQDAANRYFASTKELLENIAINYKQILTTENSIEDKIEL